MKNRLSKILVVAALLMLSACDRGDSSKKEIIAAPAGIPQGRVNVQNDQNNFCDIGANSLTCSEWGRQCTQPIQFTDLNSLCQNVRSALRTNWVCGQVGLNAIVNQRCAGVNSIAPGQPGYPQNPQQPLDPNFREVQCEFEAFRVKKGRFFDSQTGTGLIKTSMIIDGRRSQEINLRSRFLGFDIGHFGLTKLSYIPANLKGTSDNLVLSNRGLNSEIMIKQSGFAGQEVRIDAQNESGSMRLTVACKGLGNFKRIAAAKTVSEYTCTGKSDLGYGTEEIEVSLPYNTSLSGSETELAEKLTMAIQGDRVQLTAVGVASDVTVQTSAFLKEKVQLTIKDLGSDVDVTCSPK